VKLQAPQFLVDVFRDLRDRRLLIPAGLLIVALVAVPTLLSRSSEPAAPPLAEPGGLSADASATQPAVLTESVSVRDYEERLEDLKNKNPFAEQFSVPATDGGGLEEEIPVGGEPPVDDGGLGGALDAIDAGGSTDASVSGGTTGSTDSGTSPDPQEPEVRSFYYTWRIDVTAGPVGGATQRDNVKVLSPLPSRSNPVALFLGITESGEEAVFAVDNEAIVDDTDGTCVPRPSNCRYLVLGKGQGASFDYAPDSTKYRIGLRKIRRIEIDQPGKIAEKF
jgi:hypothetical protein